MDSKFWFIHTETFRAQKAPVERNYDGESSLQELKVGSNIIRNRLLFNTETFFQMLACHDMQMSLYLFVNFCLFSFLPNASLWLLI